MRRVASVVITPAELAAAEIISLVARLSTLEQAVSTDPVAESSRRMMLRVLTDDLRAARQRMAFLEAQPEKRTRGKRLRTFSEGRSI